MSRVNVRKPRYTFQPAHHLNATRSSWEERVNAEVAIAFYPKLRAITTARICASDAHFVYGTSMLLIVLDTTFLNSDYTHAFR